MWDLDQVVTACGGQAVMVDNVGRRSQAARTSVGGQEHADAVVPKLEDDTALVHRGNGALIGQGLDVP